MIISIKPFFGLCTSVFVRQRDQARYCEKTLKTKGQRTISLTSNVSIRVHDGDNGAIRRGVLPLKGKARFLSAAPENKLADARAGRIDSDHRFALWQEIFVEGLNYEQLAMTQRIVLDGGNDGSNYARELHFISRES